MSLRPSHARFLLAVVFTGPSAVALAEGGSSHVIPPGQESLVMDLLGGSAPIGDGCSIILLHMANEAINVAWTDVATLLEACVKVFQYTAR